LLFSILDLAAAYQPATRKIRKFNLTNAFHSLKDVWQETVSDHDAGDTNLSCDDAMNQLILQLPSPGSIFYALMNGWYLGQWADYSTCLADTNNG
jgi:hypothetical protein